MSNYTKYSGVCGSAPGFAQVYKKAFDSIHIDVFFV